ncbi:Nuclease [Phytophthora nicotianae]|uniref:Nuclease n=1 Tax=Phytophthora nicotianae TaxID=4792 RepID=A0A0W8C923_PHYNI|nr:Nuclease [Phytophthora nicotianae]
MKGRRQRAQARSLYNLLPANIRRTLEGVSLGISIGVAGTLILLGIDEEIGKPSRRVPIPTDRKPLEPKTLPKHEALRYGTPSDSNIHVRSGYVVSYDYRTRNASWVMEYLTKDSLRIEQETDRANSKFTVDKDVPEQFRVHPNRYLKSGYDKGHLAPARNMSHSQGAMDESFLMTNMSPQVGVGFNRGYWSRLEGFVRHLAGQYDAVYVITGPLFLPKKNRKTGEYEVSYPVIGTPPDAISVPTHFFKVVLGEKRGGKGFATAGFILPNRAIPENKNLRDFQAPLHIIEKQAGLLFFDKLDGVEKVDLCSETKCALAAAYRRASSSEPNVGMSLNEHDAAASGLMGVEETPPPAPLVRALGPQQAEVVIKRNQSKYDFVKVRVWVEDHVYVLSRYLLCRALVSAKTLVDLNFTDIVQEQFEDFLYKTMLVFGYGEPQISCYRMMSSFHRNRVPLLIMLAGTACIGKSTLATKLADRLNLSSVLQTDLIFELMCNFSGQEKTSYIMTKFQSTDDLIAEYQKECEVVRKGVKSDIDKCLKDGKSLIIEGFHIDPRLYQKTIGAPEKDSNASCSGIVVPFLLTLDEEDHHNFMTNSPDPRYRGDKNEVGFRNLQDVQNYLVSHNQEKDMLPFTEIRINLHSFHDTLDYLHDVVLKRIEEVFVSNKAAGAK